MKSIKYLLVAFAFSFMFASCAKEEMPVAQENVIASAELLGTNISVNFGKAVDTKMTASAGWESTDQLGFGWTGASKGNVLALNHMFTPNAQGIPTTKGNVYAGWHFGYYPFVYQETPNQPLVVDINPDQTELGGDAERYSSSLWLSPIKSLTKANDLDPNTLQLKTRFDMFQVSKSIIVNAEIDNIIKNDPILKDLKIKSITISTPNKGIFVEDGLVTVKPSALTEMQYDTDSKYSESLTKENFYKTIANALEYNLTTEATVYVDNEDINLSANQTLRVNTMPRTIDMDDINKTDYYIQIKTEGGQFKVQYVDKAEKDLMGYEKDNNAAIQKLVDAFKGTGAMASFTPNATTGDHRPGIGLDLNLDKALFAPDFTKIQSEEEWNTAVKIANSLGLEKVTFKIAKTAEGKYWRFKDVDGDGNLINLPDADLTVQGVTMILAKEGEWPTEGMTVMTNVQVEADLTVAGILTTTKNVVNKATIFAGEEATVDNLNNTDGRVVVDFGAYVYPETDQEGVIAYVVDNAEPANIVRINTLLKNNTLGNANINTLIVKTALDLNAVAVAGVENDDRYNSNAVDFVALSSLNKINIELAGGSLVHNLEGDNTTVANVKAVSGINTIDDVVVANDITIVEGATLNVNSSIAKPYFVRDIYNEGTLNSNVEVLSVRDLNNYESGEIVVESGKYIFYSRNYAQNGMAKGNILEAGILSGSTGAEENYDYKFVGSELQIFTAEGMVYASGLTATEINAKGVSTLKLMRNIDMAGINWTGIPGRLFTTLDGNDKTISHLSGTGILSANNDAVSTSVQNLTVNGAVVYVNTKYAGVIASSKGAYYGTLSNVTVKNAKVSGSKIKDTKMKYGVMVGQVCSDSGSTEFENCNVENAVVAGYEYAGGLVGYVATDITFTNCSVKNETLTAANTGKLYAGKEPGVKVN